MFGMFEAKCDGFDVCFLCVRGMNSIMVICQMHTVKLLDLDTVGQLIVSVLNENGHSNLVDNFSKQWAEHKSEMPFKAHGTDYYDYLQQNKLLKKCPQVEPIPFFSFLFFSFVTRVHRS